MKKEHKKILFQVVLPIVASGVVLFFVVKKFGSGAAASVGGGGGMSSGTSNAGFPLQQGSRGDLVKTLQKKIGATADGIFGPKTEAALIAKTGKKSVSSQAELNSI